MLEKDIKNAILDWLSWQCNCFAFVHDSVGIYDPVKKRYRKRLSRHAINGVADILGVWNGRPLAIEVKGPKGKPTDDQIAFLTRWRNQGGIAIIARSVKEAEEAIRWQEQCLRQSKPWP